ncbi:hypothetical protein OUZ56_008068 [Daphnia magna]|uniref:Uncharacterized protein n=1 Tax=Daphnia magna TaxID=35525 RepID=A0ABR0ABU9_9CRUS|nr:hypothetical protein OUZ56_008068 [Daphnia magna]
MTYITTKTLFVLLPFETQKRNNRKNEGLHSKRQKKEVSNVVADLFVTDCFVEFHGSVTDIKFNPYKNAPGKDGHVVKNKKMSPLPTLKEKLGKHLSIYADHLSTNSVPDYIELGRLKPDREKELILSDI